MAIVDLRKVLPGGRNQTQIPADRDLIRLIDFSEFPVTSGDTVQILDIPAGFVREQQDVILIKAEGGTGTVDIGISGATDSFLDGGNVNGTINAIIAKGTNAATVARTLFATDTVVSLIPNNDLDAAIILVVIRGYMTNVRA